MLICLQTLKPEVIVINTVIEMALSKKKQANDSLQAHFCTNTYMCV